MDSKEQLDRAGKVTRRRTAPRRRVVGPYDPERNRRRDILRTWSIGLLVLALFVFVWLFIGRDVMLRPQSARRWIGAAADGDIVYVFGGQDMASDSGLLDEILALNLGSHGAGIAGHLPWPTYRPQICALNGELYILGGSSGSEYFSEILRFDRETKEYMVAGHLPEPRALGGVAEAGGKLYYVGGCDKTRYFDEVVEFDPSTGEAQILMTLPAALNSPAVAATEHRLYVVGGRDKAGNRSDLILEIDLVSAAVLRTGHLPSPRTWTAATALGDVVYVFGGLDREPLDDIIAITTTASELEVDVLGHLEQPLARHVAAVVGDRIVLIGGDPIDWKNELLVIEVDPESLAETRHRFRGIIQRSTEESGDDPDRDR